MCETSHGQSQQGTQQLDAQGKWLTPEPVRSLQTFPFWPFETWGDTMITHSTNGSLGCTCQVTSWEMHLEDAWCENPILPKFKIL